MLVVSESFILIVTLLHCLFFKLESIDFLKPHILKRFGLNVDEGKVVKTWALNQGFYNLFLAFGLFYSLYLINCDRFLEGKTLANYLLAVIAGAGLVLLVSAPQKKLAAAIQGIPAIIGLIFLFLTN